MGYSKSTKVADIKAVQPRKNIDASSSNFSTKKPYLGHEHIEDLPDGEYTPQQITARMNKREQELTKAIYAADNPVLSEKLTPWAKSSAPVIDKGDGFPAITSGTVDLGREA